MTLPVPVIEPRAPELLAEYDDPGAHFEGVLARAAIVQLTAEWPPDGSGDVQRGLRMRWPASVQLAQGGTSAVQRDTARDVSQENLELHKRASDAFNRRDLDALLRAH